MRGLAIVVVAAFLILGCGEEHERPRSTVSPSPPTPTTTSTPAVGADSPCTFDGLRCRGACFTGPCIYDEGLNRCVCQPAFDVACDEFALGGCPGHSCFAPGQICITVSDDPFRSNCGCVAATTTARPNGNEAVYGGGQ